MSNLNVRPPILVLGLDKWQGVGSHWLIVWLCWANTFSSLALVSPLGWLNYNISLELCFPALQSPDSHLLDLIWRCLFSSTSSISFCNCLVPLVACHLFMFHLEPWFSELGQILQFEEDSFQIWSPGKKRARAVSTVGIGREELCKAVKWWAWNNCEARRYHGATPITGASPPCPLPSCQTFSHTS